MIVYLYQLEWLLITDTIENISRIAEMDSKRKPKKEGSLWERDELCVRYIIEEGKLNMLLRMMNDFKNFQYKILSRELSIQVRNYAFIIYTRKG